MVNLMTKVELSLFIEANYPLTGRGLPRKPVHGVGINDAPYVTKPTINGIVEFDQAYESWRMMIKRACSKESKVENPTYADVTVCAEWSSFMAFRQWWLSNYRDGWKLDKDLLVVGNREYGPHCCVYVPQWLNTFTIGCKSSRGEHPIGVSIDKSSGKYKSRCSNPITGKNNWLGLFNTPEAAHQAWLEYKLSLAEQLKPEMDAIDVRIYPNVVTIIKSA